MFGEREKLKASVSGRGRYSVGVCAGDKSGEEVVERVGPKLLICINCCLGSISRSSLSSRRAPRFCVRGQQSVQYPWSQSVHWYMIDLFLHLSQGKLEIWTSLNVLCGFLAGCLATSLPSDSICGLSSSWSEPSRSQYLKSWSMK